MVIPLRLCELASQLLQLLVHLSAGGALPVNLAKRSALSLGRTGGGLVDGCTPLIQLRTEMLAAFGLLQFQLVHLALKGLGTRRSGGVRAALVFQLRAEVVHASFQFGNFALRFLEESLDRRVSLLCFLQRCLRA
ncbi:hypothetical protein GR234_36565, partial [Rhizobium leguminosarum]|nr:hypothetical protein [Rhizobium leguminosarum]